MRSEPRGGLVHLIALVGLAIVVFASTNIDDIFVLLGFFADRRLQGRNVGIGQYFGIGALVAVSIVASLVSLILAPSLVGLLGVLPILIGVKKLFELRRAAEIKMRAEDSAHSGAFGQIASVAAVTVANGGDNLGIYAPLFATQSAPEVAVMVIVFAVMTALWIAIAYRLVSHPTLGAPIRRYGHSAVPFVLMGLGVYVLYDVKSFDLVSSVSSILRRS
jgi:cadmium resistance protein CadD (predicted permease)